MHYWYDPHFNTSQAWRPSYSFEYVPGERHWIDVVVYENQTNDVGNSNSNSTINNQDGSLNVTDSSLRITNRISIPDRVFLVNIYQQEVLRMLPLMDRPKWVRNNDQAIKLIRRRSSVQLYPYAVDMVPFMDAVDRHRNKTKEGAAIRGEKQPQPPPILMQFGDMPVEAMPLRLPVLAKWSHADLRSTQDVGGIVCKMESPPHFANVPLAETDPVPWEEKVDTAVFRGNLNGYNHTYRLYAFDMRHLWENKPIDGDVNPAINPNWTIREGCDVFERCRLAYNLHNSSLVDAGIRLALNVSGRDLSRPSLAVSELLRYKMLISVEGNDVATGLKWNVMSNSVVLMVPPFKSTFVLEHLLEPWVHYVPLEPALDRESVEERVRWVIDHEDEARAIAARARTFMQDLWHHQEEEEEIMDRIAQRYLALW